MTASGDPAPASIGGATHVVGVIGWPVEHSLSPVIHNAAFDALGMDWVYVPLPVPPGAMPPAADGLVSLGFRGANVTMPHKTECAELADELADDAKRLRAVNTLVVAGDRLQGHNTDTPGFDRFLRRDVGLDPQGFEDPMGGSCSSWRLGRRSIRRRWRVVRPRMPSSCCSVTRHARRGAAQVPSATSHSSSRRHIRPGECAPARVAPCRCFTSR